jgi:hypothetical protein
MFTGQMERDVSVGMDSETLLWDLPGPILVRYLKKNQEACREFYPFVYASVIQGRY